MQKKDWGKSLRIELLLFKQIMKDILQQEQGGSSAPTTPTNDGPPMRNEKKRQGRERREMNP
jgi:hypothetical protein